jgi:hypothetical protein
MIPSGQVFSILQVGSCHIRFPMITVILCFHVNSTCNKFSAKSWCSRLICRLGSSRWSGIQWVPGEQEYVHVSSQIDCQFQQNRSLCLLNFLFRESWCPYYLYPPNLKIALSRELTLLPLHASTFPLLII